MPNNRLKLTAPRASLEGPQLSRHVSRADKRDAHMKKVYVAKNPADAHLLRALLEGEGIEANVMGEFLYTCRGEVPISPDSLPSVWVVHDADSEKAEEIIRQYKLTEDGTKESGEEWKCAGCGETNEGVFTECWQCGKSRSL